MCFASCAVHKKQSKFSPFIRKYLVSITQEMKGGGGREAPCLPPPINNVRVRERARVQMMFWLLLLLVLFLLLLLFLASTAGTSLDTSIYTHMHMLVLVHI